MPAGQLRLFTFRRKLECTRPVKADFPVVRRSSTPFSLSLFLSRSVIPWWSLLFHRHNENVHLQIADISPRELRILDRIRDARELDYLAREDYLVGNVSFSTFIFPAESSTRSRSNWKRWNVLNKTWHEFKRRKLNVLTNSLLNGSTNL